MTEPPPRAHQAPKSKPESDVVNNSDTADAEPDTEPLQTLNSYGAGWGASWGSVVPSEIPARVERNDRPVLGDLELPSTPDPFAFPTPSTGPARGERTRMAQLGVGALAVLAAVGGLVFWLMNRAPSSPESDNAGTTPPGTTTTTTSTTAKAPSRNVEAETRLVRMLPPGYPPGACKPVDPVPGAVAMFDCTNNSDPGGPTSASYLMARDKAALDAAFTGAVRADAVVNCPGNIQSPGPWRRNATPQQISGTVVCGVQANVATVAWTDEERMLVSIVRSDPPGPSLDQLYQWWSSHS